MFFKTTRSTKTVANSVSLGFTHSQLPSRQNQSGTAGLAIGVRKRTSREQYAVADFVGRCFLRACYWFDVCTSWAKKYNPPAFTTAGAKAQTIPATPSSAMMAEPTLHVQSTMLSRTQNKP